MKIILIIAALLLFAPTNSVSATECKGIPSNKCERISYTAQRLIKTYGWRCTEVYKVWKSSWTGNLDVWCKKPHAEFELYMRGGQWRVKAVR